MQIERVLPQSAVADLPAYVATGGGTGLERARQRPGADVIAEVERSGLRGRGGAGFPTGRKWRSVASGDGPHFAVANGAEGEPSTFKDRALLRANPYRCLEGLLIAAHAVGATELYFAMKESFTRERARVEAAVREIADAGWLEDLSVTLVAGPDEYLFGEEKALLEVIEGREPLPRWLPPYLHGLHAAGPQLGWESRAPGAAGSAGGNPTLVNNVETLAHVAMILQHGSEWFRETGTDASPGSIVCTVVGDVERPCVLEVPMGTPLHAVISAAGGPRPGRRVKAVVSGAANPVLTADRLETPLTYEDLEAVGSGLGAAGFSVYDDTTCMADVAALFSRFLAVESCGQCPPCKLGSSDITRALEQVRDGEGSERDLDVIEERLRIVTDGNRCYLGMQERVLIGSIVTAFPEDVQPHLTGTCAHRRDDLVIPKIVDLEDGLVVYDDRQMRKRPDWTYAD